MANKVDDVMVLFQTFWGGFGVPAFVNNSVPLKDEDGKPIKKPYLTYSINFSDWGIEDLQQIKVWTESESFDEVAKIAGLIYRAIPTGGITLTLPDNSGGIYIYRGTPFIQDLPTEPPNIKAIYVNVITRSYIL